jgi:hypothetical protein
MASKTASRITAVIGGVACAAKAKGANPHNEGRGGSAPGTTLVRTGLVIGAHQCALLGLDPAWAPGAQRPHGRGTVPVATEGESIADRPWIVAETGPWCGAVPSRREKFPKECLGWSG